MRAISLTGRAKSDQSAGSKSIHQDSKVRLRGTVFKWVESTGAWHAACLEALCSDQSVGQRTIRGTPLWVGNSQNNRIFGARQSKSARYRLPPSSGRFFVMCRNLHTIDAHQRPDAGTT